MSDTIKTEQLARLKTLSIQLDSKFKGPLGLRFGWDAILGLVPVLGDVVTTVASSYIVISAINLGCSPATLVRMTLNLVIESLVGAIPVLGNVFDFFWKANNKNILLLERHVTDPRGTTLRSRWLLIFTFLLLCSLIVATAVAAYFILKFIITSF